MNSTDKGEPPRQPCKPTDLSPPQPSRTSTLYEGSTRMAQNVDERTPLMELEAICQRLQVPSEQKQEAGQWLHKLRTSEAQRKSTDTEVLRFPEHAKRCCCVSFVCSRRFVFSYRDENDTGAITNAVHLSALLKECNLTMEEFFRYMRHFLALLCIPAPVSDQLTRIEVNWQSSKYMFERYKFNFTQFVNFEFPSAKEWPNPDTEISIYASSGWLLFALTKGKLLKDPPDLNECMSLLICCLYSVITRVPQQYRKRQDTPQQLLTILCRMNSSEVMDISKKAVSFNAEIVDLFSKRIPTKFSEPIIPGAIVGDVAVAISSYEVSPVYKTILLQDYRTMLHQAGDFDEYWFINDGDNATNTPPTPIIRRLPIVKASHVPSSFKFQLATVSWLQHVLLDKLDAPSSDLLSICSGLSIDISEIVTCMHQLLGRLFSFYIPILAETVFQIGKQSTETINVDSSHFTVIAKLFFKLIEELITEEAQLASHFNISALLSNQTFIRAVLACAITVVLYCYRIYGLSVTTLLTRLEIDWFSFGKILPEIIGMQSLSTPPDLEDYLLSLETKVLSKNGWTSKSPVFETNSVATAPPKESSLATAKGIFSTPQKPAAGKFITAKPQTPHSIKVFMLKVFDLVGERLRLLLEKLFPFFSSTTISLYDLVGKAVVHAVCSANSQLLQDRHLDQLILCSMYGVSKAHGISLRFSEIIAAYDAIPGAKSKVYRNVMLQEGVYGDIIKFYNELYLPVMGNFLQHLVTVTVKQQKQQELLKKPPQKSTTPSDDTTSESSDSDFEPELQTPKKAARAPTVMMSPYFRASVPMSPSRCAVIDFKIGSSPARAFAHVNQLLRDVTPSARNRLPPPSPGSTGTGGSQPILPVKRPISVMDPENSVPGTPTKRLRVDPTLPPASSLATPTAPTPPSTH